MIVLDNGDKIRGDAAAATVVDYTLHGLVGETITQLADGQLAATIGDLYTASAIVVVASIVLVNTDTSARAINLYLTPSGGTARRIVAKDLSLGVGYSLHFDGAKVSILDQNGAIAYSYATHASSHLVGGGDALTTGIADNDLLQVDHVSPADDDYAKFTASGLEGRSYTEVRTDLGLVIGTNVQAYDADLTTYAGITPSANIQTLLGAADYATFKTSLSLNSVENTALSTWAGTANITTTGTVGTGTWNSALNIVGDTTPQLGGEMDCQAFSIGFTQQTATGDGTTTINWGLGNKFYFTFGAQNDTFTFTAPAKPGNLLLVLKQDATGSRTATWPATVLWPTNDTVPTLTTGANTVDIVSFYYDGTSYHGVASLDFA